MRLSSPAFENSEFIPTPYTNLGSNISPPLLFSEVPREAKSLVLILEDLDATPVPWTHWLVFNIPAGTTEAPEGGTPPGGIEGLANGGTPGYEGPNQIYFSGVHSYQFSLYALDVVLDLSADADTARVTVAMDGHVLAQAQLIGLQEGVASSVP